VAEAAISPSAVKGLGFDATCSLVVLDAGANPLTVSSSGDIKRNVIVWMDHRAIAEARQVNDTQDDVLRYVGGSISPEMEIPKLLWLKRHLPSTYSGAGHFFDLADYLSFRATGSTVRSICTLACKWNFLAHEQRWSDSYFERIGLGDLASEAYAKVGKEIVAPGTPLGAGLTRPAAYDLGLLEGTPVGASLIDAHAGGVGTKSRARRSMCAVVLPTSWALPPASWQPPQRPASSRAFGVLTTRAWCQDSGSMKAASPRRVQRSTIS
jgi:D-ribulokinase